MNTKAGFRRHFLYTSILSIIIIVFLFSTGCSQLGQKEMTSSEQDLFIVTETYPTEFILYGDDMNLDPACHVKKIDAITEENLQMDDTYKFSVLVINDINENAPVSDDELKLLISIVDQGKLHFYYFGNRLIDQIISEGNYTTYDIKPYEMFIARVHRPLESLCILGVWTDEEQKIYETIRPEILQEAFLRSVVRGVIKPSV